MPTVPPEPRDPRPDPHVRAAFYLSPTLDAWWRWADDGGALAWPDGRTIAFMPEVEAVLSRLAPGGLPPFGAVALLLAACRDGWADSPGRAEVLGHAREWEGLPNAVDGRGASQAAKYARVAAKTKHLVAGLDAVAALPHDLRATPAGRAALVETVFEAAADRGTPADADLVVAALAAGVRPETLRPRLTNEDALGQFEGQINGLTVGLSRVDAAALDRRMRTGLDDPVRPAEDDVSPPERVRRLLASLRNDPELGGVAKLAADLMAAVAVPRSLRAREELPMGGVSDLTNRGSLDRLLVSELAHDDLTLAVRVAVNEALYLRRESPPREPPHGRAILIDAGVRTWGLPRAYCAAVALALAATNEKGAALRAFRAAAGGRVVPVDLTTREGLESHLAALETAAHPGASLAAFLAEAAGPGDESPTDAFVLTQTDAAVDPAFVAAARAVDAPLLYVAAVDREGAFVLTARTPAGPRLVREARLSLDALTRPPTPARPAAPLVDRRTRAELPAIFSAEPFPLKLHHRADGRSSLAIGSDELVSIVPDGRVLHWRGGLNEGATQLHGALPPGPVLARRFDPNGRTAFFVVGRRNDRTIHVVLADLDGDVAAVVPIDHDTSGRQGAFFAGPDLCVVVAGKVEVFDVVGGGRHVGTVAVSPALRWKGGRYFQSGHWGDWHMLTLGATPRLESIGLMSAAAVFDCDLIEGPMALMPDGQLRDLQGREQGKLPPKTFNRDYLAVSPDGRSVVYGNAQARYLADLRRADAEPGAVTRGLEEEVLLAPAIYVSVRASWGTRTKFAAIGLAADMRPVVFPSLSERGAGLVPVAGTGGVLRLDHAPGGLASTPQRQAFVEVPKGGPTRVRLKVATWADGSRAWLDARGLLHLRSSDASVPELSMTLCDNGSAAWTSDGKVCGPRFNIGADATPADPAHFVEVMRRFGQRLR